MRQPLYRRADPLRCNRYNQRLIDYRNAVMNAAALLAVGLGAACGAWIRWWLGTRLNPLLAHLPLGTLVANLSGGYLIGVALALFTVHHGLPHELRLFVITGFLGALTTFSTFSAEVVQLFQAAHYGWAVLTAGVHLAGSLTMTALGFWTIARLQA